MVRKQRAISLLVIVLSAVTVFSTVIPTVYTLDSAEFSTGAYTLGFVHSPGYPLYLLLLNGFMHLSPAVTDVGYRANMFSAVCLVITVWLAYQCLRLLTQNLWIAAGTALTFGWSYHVWLVGLFAEVYAPQIMGVALAAWSLLRLLDVPSGRRALVAGLCVGVAVALHPSNALFAPGVALAYIGCGVRWRWSIASGLVAFAVFGLSLLYFPMRYRANPALNLAGHYDASGVFHPVNLQSLEGVLWMVSGQQFEGLFFADGVGGLVFMARVVVENYLLFGVLIGGYGLVAWWGDNRWAVGLWVVCLLPFALFYGTYGAVDKRIMFAPVLLLWTMPLALGWRALLAQGNPRLVYGFLLAGVVVMLAVNYPRLNLSDEREVRVRSEAVLAAAPDDAVIFGWWGDIVTMEYLHIVEQQRPDLSIYNLFMFPPGEAAAYMRERVNQGQTVWIVGYQEVPDPGADVDMTAVILDNLPPDVTPYTVFSLSRP